MAVRFFADSFWALALPPFNPPLRPRSVKGVSDEIGESGGIWPVAMSMMSLARCAKSLGRGGRLGTSRVSHAAWVASGPDTGSNFKLDALPAAT